MKLYYIRYLDGAGCECMFTTTARTERSAIRKFRRVWGWYNIISIEIITGGKIMITNRIEKIWTGMNY